MRSPRACRAAVLIGETADELEALVADRVPVRRAASMDEAVAIAAGARAARGRRAPGAGGRQLRHVRRLRRARRRVPRRGRADRGRGDDGGHDRGRCTARGRAQDRASAASDTSRPTRCCWRCMALTAIGIVMVYSASSVRSYFSRADPAAQGLEQLVWAAHRRSSAWSWRCGSTSATCATWRSRSTSSRSSCSSSCSCPASARRSTARGAGSSSPASARSSRPSSRSSPSSSTWPTGSTGAGGRRAASGTGSSRSRLLVAPGFLLIAAEPDLGTAGVYVVVADQHLLHGRRQPALPRARSAARCWVRPG